MTTTTDHTDAGTDRYAQLELVDGSVVIYDVENPTAWLQSDASVGCESIA